MLIEIRGVLIKLAIGTKPAFRKAVDDIVVLLKSTEFVVERAGENNDFAGALLSEELNVLRIEVAAVGEVGAVEVDGVVGGEGLVGRDHLVAGLLEGQRAAPSDEAAATGDENALGGHLGDAGTIGGPAARSVWSHGGLTAPFGKSGVRLAAPTPRQRTRQGPEGQRGSSRRLATGWPAGQEPLVGEGEGERGKELGLFRLGGADPKRRNPVQPAVVADLLAAKLKDGGRLTRTRSAVKRHPG